MTAPRTPRKPTLDPRLDLYILSQQRVEAEVAKLHDLSRERHEQVMKILGSEDLDEKGAPIGRGLTGRVMRLEVWKRTTDGWLRYGAGAMATATLFMAAFWWLTSDTIGKLFKH